MTERENKQIARRFYEDVLTEGQIGLIDKLVAGDFVEHETAPGQQPPDDGREALREMVEQIRAGLPDLEVSVDEITARDDLVTVATTWRGTHEGLLWGIEPTGNRVEFRAIDLVRIEDGQAREHWGCTDNLSLLSQIGAVELPSS